MPVTVSPMPNVPEIVLDIVNVFTAIDPVNVMPVFCSWIADRIFCNTVPAFATVGSVTAAAVPLIYTTIVAMLAATDDEIVTADVLINPLAPPVSVELVY